MTETVEWNSHVIQLRVGQSNFTNIFRQLLVYYHVDHNSHLNSHHYFNHQARQRAQQGRDNNGGRKGAWREEHRKKGLRDDVVDVSWAIGKFFFFFFVTDILFYSDE